MRPDLLPLRTPLFKGGLDGLTLSNGEPTKLLPTDTLLLSITEQTRAKVNRDGETLLWLESGEEWLDLGRPREREAANRLVSKIAEHHGLEATFHACGTITSIYHLRVPGS